MNFIDLFAGIGGFRLGMERAGHKCIGFCEIDKYARKTYKANFNTEGEWERHDIRSVTDDDVRRIGNTDIICGGFPCQAFSIAGKRKGFEDTRGTLFFEIMRFASILGPKYLFLENVGGLLNHNGGDTFETILRALDDIGYDAEWQVCNSKNFGVPQNRERVFIVGHLRGASTRKVFPIGGTNGKAIKIIGKLDGKFRSRNDVLNINGISTCLDTAQGGGHQPKVMVVPVLTPDRLEKRQNGRRFKNPGEPMLTLTGQDRHGVAILQRPRGNNKGGIHDTAPTVSSHSYHENNYLLNNARIRKLIPLECFRLQGFPDEHYHRAKEAGISDSQLYKQAGNSVTVNVIYEIGNRLGVKG
ncbi:DNA cytosine methyltransferase [Anaerosinus massiliensis]|uniref:DNA cytosine methyltransferase n=1 Tax=Massilibacillus massiliensis TaxID=1806837 RepID=UPI000B0F083B|nr:DNA cytosine methyltransferase [Massilibacillus massiliensis]